MIGIDLIRIARMERLMARYGDHALQRFLSPEEIALVRHPRTAAGFWAAKEACSKALGTGIGAECSFHDITLSKNERGAPQIALSERLNTAFSISAASLSITHDGDYAIAVVALEKSPPKE